MQSTAPTPPTPPAAPVPTLPTPAIAGTPQIDGQVIVRPATMKEVQALRARGSELSNQLSSASGRRNELARKLLGSDPAARAGIEQRIQLLDQRILGLEADIAQNGRMLAQARPELLSGTRDYAIGAPIGRVIGVGSSMAMFAIMAVVIFKTATRRARWSMVNLARSPEIEGRLDRLEQGVEAIAVEVERIAEGQRFVTKLMTEAKSPLALEAGQAPAEPIPLRQRDEVPIARQAR